MCFLSIHIRFSNPLSVQSIRQIFQHVFRMFDAGGKAHQGAGDADPFPLFGGQFGV